jgi:hypothetical protein
MNQTPHQERSTDAFQKLNLAVDPFKRREINIVRDTIYKQMQRLGMFNVTKWLAAKEDKKNGGQGMSHLKYYTN